MFRRVLAIFSILAFLIVFYGVRGATTSAASSPIVDFASMQKSCAVIAVHLSGSQHTITCRQTRVLGVKPNLNRQNCGLPNVNIIIFNYDNTAELCFGGTGYLGVAIYQINQVLNEASGTILPEPAWILYYPAHRFCTVQAGADKNFGTGYTGIEITQLDYGNSNGPNC